MNATSFDRLLFSIFLMTAILSVFQAAAFSTKLFPLSPAVLGELLFALFLMLQFSATRQGMKISNRQEIIIISIFLIYSMGTAFTLPFIFEGMLVYVPRNGITLHANGFLRFSISNIGEAIYLLLNALLFVGVFNIKIYQADKKVIKVFLLMGVVALFFSLYQKISQSFGIFFPYQWVNSNAFYYQGYNQTVASGLARGSGTFTEPSYNGNFLGMYFVYYLVSVYYKLNFKRLVMALLYLYATLIATSSLGYIEIMFGVAIIFMLFISNLSGRIKISKIYVIALFSIIFSLVAIYFSHLLYLEVFDKLSSMSAIERANSNFSALLIFANTYGFGVGLGSNRPSSFALYLLSNVGIIGTFAFSLFIFFILNNIVNNYKIIDYERKSLLFAFLALLVGKIAGAPDLSFTSFWVVLIIVAVVNKSIDRSANHGAVIAETGN
ncbi:hypothetical protein [Acidithiobacillus sp.]